MERARLAIVGGGPAGLMAAEVASNAGIEVDLYESKGSVGRKFLIAGRGGLNLTHAEHYESFVSRYGGQRTEVAKWLSAFNADAVRAWARELGVETFVGTSQRIFPLDMKAAPLLRAWVRRLRSQGVRFHVHHRCVGLDADLALTMQTQTGTKQVRADAIVLAMGGGSWPQLGSDGCWVEWLQAYADIAPLVPANCGFDAEWSSRFSDRFAGAPVKTVAMEIRNSGVDSHPLRGEFVVTRTGVEGSVVYALSSRLRNVIAQEGTAAIGVDLLPDVPVEPLHEKLNRPRQGRSLTEHLRRSVGIEGVKMGLLYECVPDLTTLTVHQLAVAIKSVSVRLLRPRPIEEAISTAGGVRISRLQELMLANMPGVFCAGEMVDWEAPTGGYLLTACFASGRVAANGAISWLSQR